MATKKSMRGEPPKCLICGEPVSWDTSHARWHVGCCKEHGYSIRSINVNKTKKLNGTENFGFNGNEEHDRKVSEARRSEALRQVAEGKCMFKYNGDEDHDKAVFEMCHSNGIKRISTLKTTIIKSELALYEFLKSLGYNPIRNYYNKERIGRCFTIDSYIPELDIGFECEGGFKYDDNNELSYYYKNRDEIINKAGIKLIHVKWNKVKDLTKEIFDELLSKLNDPQRLESELVEFK